jgi:hypothetical protein
MPGGHPAERSNAFAHSTGLLSSASPSATLSGAPVEPRLGKRTATRSARGGGQQSLVVYSVLIQTDLTFR